MILLAYLLYSFLLLTSVYLLILDVQVTPFSLTVLNDTPQSIWLLWTRDQPVAVTTFWKHTTFTRDRYPCSQWDSNPQSQLASGHHDRPACSLAQCNW